MLIKTPNQRRISVAAQSLGGGENLPVRLLRIDGQSAAAPVSIAKFRKLAGNRIGEFIFEDGAPA
jgi:hypothetical protein